MKQLKASINSQITVLSSTHFFRKGSVKDVQIFASICGTVKMR